MNVYLIGYRGVGKSTVAPALATRLGWSWLDLDDELERRAGMSIAEIFRAEGESAFRDLEESVLAEASGRDHQVVATGGGVIGRPANRERLAKGHVVWLTATPATILARISGDQSTAARRPNLTLAGGLAEIERMLETREPLYGSLADQVLDTETTSRDELVDAILAALAAPTREARAQ